MARVFLCCCRRCPTRAPGAPKFFGFCKISPCSEISYDYNPSVFNLTAEPVMKSRFSSKPAGGKRPGSYLVSELPPKPLENNGITGAITTIRGLHGVAPVSNAMPNSHQI